MRPLLQHAARSILANSAFNVSLQSPRALNNGFVKSAWDVSSIYQCQWRTASISSPGPFTLINSNSHCNSPLRRYFSSSSPSFDKEKLHESAELQPKTGLPHNQAQSSIHTPEPTPPPRTEDNIARVPAEDLPSHRDGQRWSLSKRLSDFMDDLLPKLAIVTHKVNTYTGTDYSGIEALRKEIKDQGTSTVQMY